MAVDLDKAAIPYWVNWLLVSYVAVHAATHLVLSVRHKHTNCFFCFQKVNRFIITVGPVLLSRRWKSETYSCFCHARSGASSKQSESFLLYTTGQERRCSRKMIHTFSFGPKRKILTQLKILFRVPRSAGLCWPFTFFWWPVSRLLSSPL